MTDTPSPAHRLTPLAYHEQIVAHLQAQERSVWAWGTSQKVRDDHNEEMRTTMLRETYRLEPESHGEIHAACQRAMASLGIAAPVTLYQAGSAQMNASLCYIPGEIHMIFQGPILEKLSDEEQLALLGHELAHYQLWSMAGGSFHAANTILDHTLAYSEATASHVETERLYGLHTELFADRGGAIAAGTSDAVITMLLKTMTGIPKPDAAAYLRQAEELEKNRTPSQGISHPEVFLRARAIDKWWRADADTETWVKDRLFGPLSLGKLDLLRQIEMTGLTQKYFRYLLADETTQSDRTLTEVRSMFPAWQPGGDTLTETDLDALVVDDSVRDYFCALTFDLAMADADVRDTILTAGALAAAKLKGLEPYRQALKRDLKLAKPVIERILAPAGLGKAA